MAGNTNATTTHYSPKTILMLAIVRTGVAVAVLVVGVIVALSPNVAYAPVPRIILYSLVALLPAILLGTEAASRLELRLPGIVFLATGSIAVFFFGLVVLTKYSKPEQQIAVFYIVDNQHQPIPNLDREGAIEVALTREGLSITKFLDGNALVLIFPEQVSTARVMVRPVSFGPTYSGEVTYTGNRQEYLVLDQDLTKDGASSR